MGGSTNAKAVVTAICAVTVAILAAPAIAAADFSATLAGDHAAFTGDAEDNDLELSWAARLAPPCICLTHNRFAAGDPGYVSGFDFDTALPGEQAVPVGGSVEVNGGAGNDRVFVSLTVGDNEVTATGTNAFVPGTLTLSYSTVDALGIMTGAGDDEVTVQESAPSVPVTVAPGAGSDTVAVGDGSLAGIQSLVRITGADSFDLIEANDAGDPDPHSYQLQNVLVDQPGVFRDAEPKLAVQAAPGFNRPRVALQAGRGGDVIGLGIDLGEAANAWVVAGRGADRLVVEAIETKVGSTLARALVLDGGAGSDTLDYGSAAADLPIEVDLGSGEATGVDGHVAGFEDVFGGAGDDVLLGNGARNALRGGRRGRDRLLGRGGGDRLAGDKGNDRIKDTSGRNRIKCGAGKRDAAVANRKSQVSRSCERVRRKG